MKKFKQSLANCRWRYGSKTTAINSRNKRSRSPVKIAENQLSIRQRSPHWIPLWLLTNLSRKPASFLLKFLKTKTTFTWIHWHFFHFRRIQMTKIIESTFGCLLQTLLFQFISHPFTYQVTSTITSVNSNLCGHFLTQLWSQRTRRRSCVQCAAILHFYTAFVVMNCRHFVWPVSKHIPLRLGKTELKNWTKMNSSLVNRFHSIVRYLDKMIAILYFFQATILSKVSLLGIRYDRKYWNVLVLKSEIQSEASKMCNCKL